MARKEVSMKVLRWCSCVCIHSQTEHTATYLISLEVTTVPFTMTRSNLGGISSSDERTETTQSIS